jgi:hypothetical protein
MAEIGKVSWRRERVGVHETSSQQKKVAVVAHSCHPRYGGKHTRVMVQACRTKK